MKNTITQDTITKKYGSLNSESEKLKFMQKMVYEMVDENYGGKIENFNILKNPNPGYIISGFFETPRMGGKRLIMGFDIGKDKIVLAPQNPQVLAYSEESETYYVAIKMALEFSERVNYLPLEFFNFAQKQMNCTKGWSCKGPNGYACLAQSKKKCNNNLNPLHKTYAGWLADRIGKGVILHSSHIANVPTIKRPEPEKTRELLRDRKPLPTSENRKKAGRTEQKNPYQDIADALKNGDIESLYNFSKQILKEKDRLLKSLPEGETLNAISYDSSVTADHIAYTLAEKAGFNEKPKIGSESEVDNIWKNGGTLTFRGVGEEKYSDTLKYGYNHFSPGSHNAYGSGMYVSSVFGGQPSAQKAEDAIKVLIKGGYSKPDLPVKDKATVRMVTDRDFKWMDHKENINVVKKLKSDLDKWLEKEIQKISNEQRYDKNAPGYKYKSMDYKSIMTPYNVLPFNWIKDVLDEDYKRSTSKMSRMKPEGLNSLNQEVFNIEIDVDSSKMSGYDYYDTNFKGNAPSFNITKLDNNKYSYTKIDGSTTVGSYADIIEEGKKDHIIKETVRIYNQRLKKKEGYNEDGEKILSPKGKRMVEEAKRKRRQIMDFFMSGDVISSRSNLLGGNLPVGNTSARLAIISGYDGIRLSRSYQPDNYATIFNRGKVTVQSEPLDNKQLLKQAAGGIK